MNSHSRLIWTISVLTIVFLMISAILASAGWGNIATAMRPLDLGTPMPNEPKDPTPFPSGSVLDLTPYPTSDVPFDQIPETRGPAVTPPTPDASQPYHRSISRYYAAMTSNKAAQATAIVSGTVTTVGPARWTTSDGARPTNPWSANNPYTIFTPDTVLAASYLKGGPGLSSSPLLMAVGGTVGQDSADSEDDLTTFNVGDKVIIFLDQQVPSQLQPFNGQTLWRVIEHYTLDNNGNAYNSYRTLTVQNLLGEMKLGN